MYSETGFEERQSPGEKFYIAKRSVKVDGLLIWPPRLLKTCFLIIFGTEIEGSVHF